MKIFVQIASYRDPELLPTIRDCIDKAKYPENLTFGICWQHDETESFSCHTTEITFSCRGTIHHSIAYNNIFM